MRRERPSPPPEPVSRVERAVRARRPNHVWMIDITEIPGVFRLFCFKLAVLLDVRSRLPLAAQVFLAEPRADLLGRMVVQSARLHGAPKHFVSDQGPQFTDAGFRAALARLGIRQRHGAIGRVGSIAVIERFWRTLKSLGAFRVFPPLTRSDLESRLRRVLLYYSVFRPHQGLAGGSPAEVYLGRDAVPRFAGSPPRGRPGERRGECPFAIAYLDREERLPILTRRAA